MAAAAAVAAVAAAVPQAIGDRWWQNLTKNALAHACRVSHHARGSMAHTEHGWGNYVLTIMGPHRARFYNEICDAITLSGLDEAELTPPPRSWTDWLTALPIHAPAAADLQALNRPQSPGPWATCKGEFIVLQVYA